MVKNVCDDWLANWLWGMAQKSIEFVTRLCINDHSCVNAVTQYAAIAALEGSQDDVIHMISEFDARRGVIVDGLNEITGIRCADAAGAFYGHVY